VIPLVVRTLLEIVLAAMLVAAGYACVVLFLSLGELVR